LRCLNINPFATFKLPFATCGKWRMGWTTLHYSIIKILDQAKQQHLQKNCTSKNWTRFCLSDRHVLLPAQIFSLSLDRFTFNSKILLKSKVQNRYRVFHGFRQAKFPDGGLVLGSSQFSILPQLHPKILDSELVKIDPKIIISFL